MFGRTLQSIVRRSVPPRSPRDGSPASRIDAGAVRDTRTAPSAFCGSGCSRSAHSRQRWSMLPASIAAHRREDQPPAPSVQAGQPTHEAHEASQQGSSALCAASRSRPQARRATLSITRGHGLTFPLYNRWPRDASAFSETGFSICDVRAARMMLLYDGPVRDRRDRCPGVPGAHAFERRRIEYPRFRARRPEQQRSPTSGSTFTDDPPRLRDRVLDDLSWRQRLGLRAIRVVPRTR